MTPLTPGLLVLHGNRLELLRDAVFAWIAAHPLDPLEEEVFLVQSNAAAEWIKIALAERAGICAATRVSLPARFVWNAYRRVLGPDRVTERSALERDALVWRLMRLLPGRLHQAIFAPVAAYLADGDVMRRLQLAGKLADLYDGYQVYRPDWLDAWESERNVVIAADGRARPLPREQFWQAALWRDLVRELDPRDRATTRPAVHRAFVEALSGVARGAQAGLPRRVVLFGASHLSASSMEALAHLSSVAQVLIAVPNPSRYHWSDILDGREALRAARRRQPLRDPQRDPATIALEDMHRHAHPLLAAWGRQGRDFMRQLDAFDDVEAARARFDDARVECFDERPGTTLLEQVQAAIRDLLPIDDHPKATIDASDRSIAFHVAHGPQREVEVLHDQLLALFDERARGDRPLRPRDVIVMVPDIEVFAPAIRAVFGLYRSDDARCIPYTIADLKTRGSDPLVVAIEWMLRIGEHRARIGELRDLFDVPAIAARFGLVAPDVHDLFSWAEDANVRWGLGAAHRAALGLEACGDQNTWSFGLERLLLGYAAGSGATVDGIDAMDGVGGLETAAIGALAELVDRLERWRRTALVDAPPATWAVRCRALLDDVVAASDERERITVAALEDALAAWLEACDAAGFDEPVPIEVAREGWLGRLEGLETRRRFLSGGVTFCTLLPLRAVPFDVVCLLGLNDRDYPRATRRDDFDLTTLPGLQRPGDRSRRDDDRYLMLEALLSARSTLYVSWSGHSARDNAVRPCSVLVAQLRDYLDAGWRGPEASSVLDARTTEHPLQPFGRRYFEAEGPVTYAREWRQAHRDDEGDAARVQFAMRSGEGADAGTIRSLTLRRLASFLRHPVRTFFRERLDVSLDRDDERVVEDETFVLGGLDRWTVVDDLLREASAEGVRDLETRIEAGLGRIAASGRLPLLDAGERDLDALRATATPILSRWHALQERLPFDAPRRRVRIAHDDVVIDDWLDGLRRDEQGATARITVTASRLFEKDGSFDRMRLLDTWVELLAASATGCAMRGIVVGCDGMLEIEPLDRAAASRGLARLLAAWREALAAIAPPPVGARTAIAALTDGRPREAYEGRRLANDQRVRGEVERDFALARAYPTFDALVERGFEAWAERLYGPIVEWSTTHVRPIAHDASAQVFDEETA